MRIKQETSGIIYKILNELLTVIIALVTKITLHDLGSFQIFFLSCLSSLFVVVIMIKLQTKASLTTYVMKLDKTFVYIAIINFTSLCAYIQALKLVDITVIHAIAYLSPIIVSLLGIFILKEKYSFKIALALVIAIVGTMIIIKPVAITSIKTLGVACALISAIGWALYSLVFKKKAATMPWTEQSFIILILCVIISLPVAIATWHPLTDYHVKFIVLLGLLYTINKMLFIKSLAKTRLVLLAPIRYTKLIFAAIFAYLLFNEVIHVNTMIGSLLIIAATMLVLYSAKKA
jgi:S-adenosylmethionine uptake transporter